MKKTKQNPAVVPPDTEVHETGPSAAHERNGTLERPDEPAIHSSLDAVTRWVRDHPQSAMLGAFGVGVFLGVLLRK
jgi:ElaB/YqjD/DUF883 family membrane-anchored ribosome-binding protein